MQWGGSQRSDLRPTTDGAEGHNPEATLVLFCWPCDSELAQFQIPITQPGKGRCGVNLAQGSGSGLAYIFSGTVSASQSDSSAIPRMAAAP